MLIHDIYIMDVCYEMEKKFIHIFINKLNKSFPKTELRELCLRFYHVTTAGHYICGIRARSCLLGMNLWEVGPLCLLLCDLIDCVAVMRSYVLYAS